VAAVPTGVLDLHRSRLTVAAVLTGALALAGCGNSATGGGSADAQVRQTVTSFETAMKARDGARACGLLTSSMRQEMAHVARTSKLGNSCEAYVDNRRTTHANSGRRAKLIGISASVDGAHATATINLEVKRTDAERSVELKPTTALVESHGKWLIAQPRPRKAGTVSVTTHLFKRGDTLASAIARQFTAGPKRGS
jgi:predicted small secreted protein